VDPTAIETGMVVHSAHDSPDKPIEIAVTAFDCGQRNSDQQAAPPGTTQARLGQKKKKIGFLLKAQDGRARILQFQMHFSTEPSRVVKRTFST
jgi:hypothetical protein